MKKLKIILKNLEQGKISADNAETQVLRLFNDGSDWSYAYMKEMKRVIYENLPNDCVKGYDKVKFCEVRNGNGGLCKMCSDKE